LHFISAASGIKLRLVHACRAARTTAAHVNSVKLISPDQILRVPSFLFLSDVWETRGSVEENACPGHTDLSVQVPCSSLEALESQADAQMDRQIRCFMEKHLLGRVC
jgi:hypothetical protein